MKFGRNFILSMAATGMVLSGCGSTSNDEGEPSAPTAKAVKIDFAAVVGNQGALVCSENNATKVYENLGTTNASGAIADFRFFVSEVMVKLSDGTTQKIALTNNANQYYNETNGSVAILDFEDNTGACINRGNDAATHTAVEGSITTDDMTTITGIEFTVGVPFALNHIEFPEIDALTKTKMAWSWASGRKFTKLEINPVDANGTAQDIFNFHLGSTGCSDDNADGHTDSCTQPNRVKIVFDNFDPETQKVQIDYAALLGHVDITTNLGGAAGCMSALNDPECMSTQGQMFNMIGLDDAGQEGLCIGGDCTEAQQIFSVID